jgi:2-polyprenyl-3-methyl-5-hydroxy-6-metoxy-1,4-benzoquinol methylase
MTSIKEYILESPVGYALWSEPFNRPKLAAIESMLKKTGEHELKILDVGCGPGTNAAFFADWDYLGIDLNPHYIEAAKLKYPGRRFHAGDATKLDVKGERFPVVLINSLMHHLSDDQCSGLLNGIHHLVGPDSAVIVQEPITPEKGERLKTFFMNQDRGDFFRPVEEWRRVFASGGFNIAAEEFYTMKLAGVLAGWEMFSALLKPSPFAAAA